MNGSPISTKKKVRILIALTILAWATQTLLHQWGFGQDVIPAPTEQFVPPSAFSAGAGALELRQQATIYGPEIHLRQVCRWSDNDAPCFAQVSDLIIDRFDANRSTKIISLDQIGATLRDAGVNLGAIHFSGATDCKVTRSDPSSGDRQALQEWLDQKVAPKKQIAATISATQPVAPIVAVRTLRDELLGDLSQRLNLPIQQLQVRFSANDTNLLNLSEPNFHFDIQPRRVRDLGEVSWDVTILTGGGQQKVSVDAQARAWQQQLILDRPVTFKEIFRDEDLNDRRVLIDRLPTELLLTRQQIIGQEAARDLTAGTVITAQLVESVPLAKSGQYVTVTLNQGSVQIRTVARAMESGSYGQTIKVRNEDTRDVYDVTLTGPQTATIGATN